MPQWPKVVLLMVLLISTIGLQLVSPRILGTFIDTATSGGSFDTLIQIALLFIGVALLLQVVSVFQTYIAETVGWTATNNLRAELMLHCLRLDLAFHKLRTPGELVERIDGDVNAMATFFSKFVIQIIGNLMLLLGVLAVLWRENWGLGLAFTIFAVVVLTALVSVHGVVVPYWGAFRQSAADLSGFVEERLGGLEDIGANGGRAYVMQRLYGYTRERIRTGRKARLIGSLQWLLPIPLFTVGLIIAFVSSAYLVTQGAITLGTAVMIYTYTALLFQPLNQITRQLDDFQKAAAGFTRIQDLLQTPSGLADGPGAAFPAGAVAVEFDGVSFGYDATEPVIADLSFRLRPGETLGLLGRTGSGKTTITRLLFRLYDPMSGVIRLGGVPLQEARRADVRQHIGMVTQDVQLFRATVRDNVTFFDSTIGDERILDALEDLGLMDWYRALPQGLDTPLVAGSNSLSAGEAQLLAFTRVFLKDPGLVILDEASSRLDPVTERLIETAIGKLLRGRTAIIIAHRLATVQRVDSIMILEQGRIREYGAREALAADPTSRFSELLRVGAEGEMQAQLLAE